MTDNRDPGWLTVFVMASSETDELRKTIKVISEGCGDSLYRIVVVLKDENCPAACEIKKYISENPGCKVTPYCQKYRSEIGVRSFLGSFAEGPFICESSHFLISMGEVEYSAATMKRMVEKSTENPDTIICASRWMKGAQAENYGRFPVFAQYCLNLAVSLLYGRRVTDFSSVFQIFPADILKRVKLEQNEKFAYLYTLIPLRMKEKYMEIPAEFIKNGVSSFRPSVIYKSGFLYIHLILNTRFTSRKSLRR